MNEHESILSALSAGDVSREDPDVRTHLAACADCRARADRLERISASLDVLANEEEGVLAEARRSTGGASPSFEALLERERVAGAGLVRTPRSKPLRWMLAAASLLLAFALGRGFLSKESDDLDLQLGGDDKEIVLETPVDRSSIKWSYDLPSGGYYRVTIVDDDGVHVVDRERVDTSHWSPSDAIFEVELPASFELTIEAFDREHEPHDTHTERVSPSSH